MESQRLTVVSPKGGSTVLTRGPVVGSNEEVKVSVARPVSVEVRRYWKTGFELMRIVELPISAPVIHIVPPLCQFEERMQSYLLRFLRHAKAARPSKTNVAGSGIPTVTTTSSVRFLPSSKAAKPSPHLSNIVW